MKISYKGQDFELDIDNITQGQAEKFLGIMRDKYENTKFSGVEYNGNAVRAFNELGFITPTIDVESSKPALIRLIAETISNALADALVIDPK